MKVLVVDADAERRADLVDAVCELPGIEVCGATHNAASSHDLLTREQIDVIVAGDLPLVEVAALSLVAGARNCTVVSATHPPAVVTALQAIAARRTEPSTMPDRLARAKYLAFERDSQQTIDLRDWLPRTVEQLRRVVPGHIELVAIVAGDTLPVRCVPEMLERLVLDLVLQAAHALPWGGTVWLTAAPGADGEVKLDVLENGLGRVLDLTLRASVPADA